VDIYHHLNDEAKDQIERIWAAASIIHFYRNQEDEEVPMLEGEIQERIIALNIALLQQPLNWNGTASNNLLSHFVGVLSFNIAVHKKNSSHQRSFNPTSTSTSFLAQFVLCARLFGLEYALPLKEYTILGWPAARTYADKVG
jgi:hypothetical protein